MRHCSLSARTREAAKSHCPRSWDEDRLLGNHFAPVRGLCLQVSVGNQVKNQSTLENSSASTNFRLSRLQFRRCHPSVRIGSYAILHPRSRDNSRQISHGLFDHLSVRSFHRTTTGGTTEVELKWSNPIAIEGCFSPPTSRRFKT